MGADVEKRIAKRRETRRQLQRCALAPVKVRFAKEREQTVCRHVTSQARGNPKVRAGDQAARRRPARDGGEEPIRQARSQRRWKTDRSPKNRTAARQRRDHSIDDTPSLGLARLCHVTRHQPATRPVSSRESWGG